VIYNFHQKTLSELYWIHLCVPLGLKRICDFPSTEKRHPAVKIKIASIREVDYAIAISGNEPLPRAAYFLVRVSQPFNYSDRFHQLLRMKKAIACLLSDRLY